MKNMWVKEFPGAVIVCDPDGIILEMNDQAIQGIKEPHDRDLVGTSLFACHTAVSQERLRHLMKHRLTNIYVSEKNGIKKLIY
ncbi:MAG: PAS domain-containing protein [Syntrophales bacterium]|jgi:PAS domain-containing protein|nr:PAS domain-containing protein [Syntrophales bacterium]